VEIKFIITASVGQLTPEVRRHTVEFLKSVKLQIDGWAHDLQRDTDPLRVYPDPLRVFRDDSYGLPKYDKP
jgi:hypothetical protein